MIYSILASAFVNTFFLGQAGNIEQQLIKRLAKGESKAFEELYLKYGRRLYVFVFDYLKSKDDAEEIVQEVFVKIWDKRSQLKEHESLKGYLFTIAYNAIKKSFLRKSREEQQKQLFAQNVLREMDNTPTEIEYSKVIQQIDGIVEAMPVRRKEVFNLSKKEGLTNAEIAAFLNLSEKTVKNQLTLAYQTIREQLKNNLPVLLLISLFY